MNIISEKWAQINPKTRHTSVTVLMIILGLGLLYLFVSAGPEKRIIYKQEGSVDQNILTGSNPDALGLDGMSAKLAEQEEKFEQIKKEIHLQKQDSNREITALKDELEKSLLKYEQLRERFETEVSSINTSQNEQLNKLKDDISQQTRNLKGELNSVLTQQKQATKQGTISSKEAIEEGLFDDVDKDEKTSNTFGNRRKEVMNLNITVVGEEEIIEEENPENNLYLPPASLISGVLINGADVPAGLQGKKDPIPVLMRIKHEAILPNHFLADVRECFVILASRADISTERVQMRGETLACVREDGGVVETKIDAYISSGKDGKTGIRGKLIHRASSLVMKAALAGFLSAFGDAFKPQAVATLNTRSTGNAEYLQPSVPDALESGSYGGISKAADMLSEYFLDLADEVLPFLEIQAKTKVDLILVEGATLTQLKAGAKT